MNSTICAHKSNEVDETQQIDWHKNDFYDKVKLIVILLQLVPVSSKWKDKNSKRIRMQPNCDKCIWNIHITYVIFHNW